MGPAIICILVGIGLSCVCGFIADSIATPKGVEHGFAWGFWLNILGIIVVALMQGAPQTYNESNSNFYGHSAEEKKPEEWKCVCGSTNSGKSERCWNCRRTKEEVLHTLSKVQCPHCGAKNSPDNVLCFACNKPMDGSEALAVPQSAPEAASPAVTGEAPQPAPAAEPAAITAAPQPAASASSFDSMKDKLRSLKQLFDDGLIDEETYKLKSHDIMNRF